MEPSPPRPAFQLFVLLLIAVEAVAMIWGNDLLMVAVLVVIVVVAFFWWRDSRARRIRAEYEPAKSEPREDWGGKRGDDGKPL